MKVPNTGLVYPMNLKTYTLSFKLDESDFIRNSTVTYRGKRRYGFCIIYPFTPPILIPPTMCFWKIQYIINCGIIEKSNASI